MSSNKFGGSIKDRLDGGESDLTEANMKRIAIVNYRTKKAWTILVMMVVGTDLRMGLRRRC